MKPTTPSDGEASGATWPAVLQSGAEAQQQCTRWRPNSCKVGSHPVAYSPHAGSFENKRSQPPTASPLLSPVLLSSTMISRASVASCKPGPCSWATNPQHAQDTMWHCPSHCPMPTDVLLYVGLQIRPCSAAVRRYGEPSALLAGGKLN